jgi:uncharacterized membrane protein
LQKKFKAINKLSYVTRILHNSKRSFSSNPIFYVIVLGYIIVLSTITVLKEAFFLTSGYDLGIFNQAFWTTIFGHHFFYETGDLSFNAIGSFFGVHFSPIMFLILPFYALLPAPETLLVIQTVVLAAGAFPIYWMGRDYLGQKAGTAVGLIYLVSPMLLFINLNDFHLEAFSSTAFLFSVYYLQKEKWGKFSACIILAISTIEFAPIIALFVIFYALLLLAKKRIINRPKAAKYIIGITILSVLWFFLALYAKSFFNPGISPVPSPFHNILQNPISSLTTDFQAKIFYIIALFGSLAFIPFFAPEMFIMLVPWFGASLLSIYAPYYSIYYQYQGFVIPFIFVALIIGLKRLRLFDAKKILALLIIPTLLFSSLLFSASNVPWNYRLPIPNENTQLIKEIANLVPSNASILTQNDLFPQFSGRNDAYMFLPQDSNFSVDYILGNIDTFGYRWRQPDIFGERGALNTYVQKQLEDGSYGVYASEGSTFLLKKGYTDNPVLFKSISTKYDSNNLLLNIGSISNDLTSVSKNILFHNETDSNGNFWYGPYADLPMGLYQATYSIKVNDTKELNVNDELLRLSITEEGGRIVLSEKQVYRVDAPKINQWFNVTLFFGLNAPTDGIEFKGDINNNHSICLDYITVKQLSPLPIHITDRTFVYSDFFIGNGTERENDLSHLNGTGTFWYGPYVSLQAGNYTADFLLKLDKAYSGKLLDIQVSSNNGKELNANLTISSDNFTELDKWQNFRMVFSIANDTNSVEFRGVNVFESAPISLLYVNVKSDVNSFVKSP